MLDADADILQNNSHMGNSSPHTQPHFSPTFQAGDFVFVSGQFAMDADGAIEGDVAQQTARCLQNIERHLSGQGLSRRDIAKATVWLRRAEDFPAYNQAYAAFFGDHRPARSTLICGLALPEGLVEIEAIALKRNAGAQ